MGDWGMGLYNSRLSYGDLNPKVDYTVRNCRRGRQSWRGVGNSREGSDLLGRRIDAGKIDGSGSFGNNGAGPSWSQRGPTTDGHKW